MPDYRTLRVFVSAVSRELGSYRNEISNTLLKLDIHPIAQDYFPPDHRTIVGLLRETIAECDAVVCVLGRAYGFEPRDFPDGMEQRSYTQLEYEIAVELGKDIYIFVADDNCKIDNPLDHSEELAKLQRDHIHRVTNTESHWTTFCSSGDLVQKVSLIRWKQELANVPVVSKGLRSFDKSDSSFFLRLLPGPYDKNGLPESIRFWKHRIEAVDESTFKVGVIYGPSGCGKSSLVKAGLLPRLSTSIIAIYVEADFCDLETRLLQRLRKRFQSLPQDLDLEGTIAALATGKGLGKGQKALIVIDQFEQWLHSRGNPEATPLSLAMQRCDGEHVQCIAMVRDDFWTALSRFLKTVNVPLRDAENAVMVDLFDPSHARRVLAKFGHAFGCWPAEGVLLTSEQEAFLDQAIAGLLSKEGRVVSLHLALSAEMLKGRPWTPATLKEVGGMAGLGIKFLEQTFGDAATNKMHLTHQEGAIAVLKTLLPDPGIKIRGQIRSIRDLYDASGYRHRPQEFGELIRMLDSELHLVKPADAESVDSHDSHDGQVAQDGTGEIVSSSGTSTDRTEMATREKYYQLTHDFLVQSIRDWLKRRMQLTRRGRAELLLETRESHWKIQKENRYLPSAREYLVIRFLTYSSNWTDSQRKMMRRSGHIQSTRATALATLLVIVATVGFFVNNARMSNKLSELLHADIKQVPNLIDDLKKYHQWTNPILQAAFRDGVYNDTVTDILNDPNSPPRLLSDEVRLRAAMALSTPHSMDPDIGQFDFLYKQLLECEYGSFPILRDHMAPHLHRFRDELWRVLEDPEQKLNVRFHAALALAADIPNQARHEDSRWHAQATFIAGALVRVTSENASDYEQIVDALKPANQYLIDPLDEIFRHSNSPANRILSANVLAKYASGKAVKLAELLANATEQESFEVLFNAVKEQSGAIGFLTNHLGEPSLASPSGALSDRIAKQRANLAIALVRLGHYEKIRPFVESSPDPLVRSHIIEGASKFGVDPELLINLIESEPEKSIRQALVLSLGGFAPESWIPSTRRQLVERIVKLYREDSDAGIHGATEWLLRHLGHNDLIDQSKVSLQAEGHVSGR